MTTDTSRPPALLELDHEQRSVRVNGQNVSLTDQGWRVLDALESANGEVLDLQTLKARAWGLEVSDDAVKQQVRRLRSALSDAGAEGLLVTDRGRGYRLRTAVRSAPTPTPHLSLDVITGVLVVIFMALLWLARPASDHNLTRVAVMPFTASSQDSTLLADGLGMEILSAIARIDGFRAISRASSSALDGYGAREIGQRLNADALLEGHLHENREGYRQVVQLIDTGTEEQIWSAGYNRVEMPESQIMADLAVHVALLLHGSAQPGMYEQMLAGPTDNVRTYEAYIRGHAELVRDTATDLQAAVGSFDAALALDPGFSMALAWQAHALARLGRDEDDETLFAAALETAQRSLTLTPGLPEAELARAIVLRERGDVRQAREIENAALIAAPHLADYALR